MATGKPDAAAALAWCCACVVVGVAVVHAYPGAYIQDPALHYLRARWMWSHPWMLVDIWDRPLFTLVYSAPAGLPAWATLYAVAKIFTVGLTAGAAWLTWHVARGYRLERAALVVPLMWLQPCVFLLCAETTPEPLFALLFALALLLYQRGRLVQSAIAVSLLILVRPEGVALAVLWAWCTIRDPRASPTPAKRVGVACTLVLAPAVWWYVAAQVTQDPLFLVHNWPPLSGPLLAALTREGIKNVFPPWSQIVGVVLAVPFVVGAAVSVWQRRLGMPLMSVVMVAITYLVGGAGLFGWAPIPSVFVCVAPAIALITLEGWNRLGGGLAWIPAARSGGVRWAIAGAVFAVSVVGDLIVVDGQASARDWRPIAEMTNWFAAHPRPIRRLIWSEAYADIRLDHDPTESQLTYGDRGKALALLAASPPGTLVVWDGDIGPSWYGLTGAQIEQVGYIPLQHVVYSEEAEIPAWVESIPGVVQLRALLRLDHGAVPRPQEFWLLYRS